MDSECEGIQPHTHPPEGEWAGTREPQHEDDMEGQELFVPHSVFSIKYLVGNLWKKLNLTHWCWEDWEIASLGNQKNMAAVCCNVRRDNWSPCPAPHGGSPLGENQLIHSQPVFPMLFHSCPYSETKILFPIPL